MIIGAYEELVTTLNSAQNKIHVHNGQLANQIVIRNTEDWGTFACKIFDCMGQLVSDSEIDFGKGHLSLDIPPCGILIAKKK